MISRWRGSRRSISGSGQVSSASGSSVWFVYDTLRVVRSHASSQPRSCSSMSRRISSGTASVGCVSFSWIANLSASSRIVARWSSSRMQSWIAHDTKKYCCSRRSCLPAGLESFGYTTLVRFSLRILASTARQYSPT